MPIRIEALLVVVPEVRGLSHVTDVPIAQRFKEVNLLPISLVISESSVRPDEGHVPMLTLARILVCSIGLELVSIPMFGAALPCEQEDNRVIAGCGHSSLPLPTVPVVQVAPAVVDLAYSELHAS